MVPDLQTFPFSRHGARGKATGNDSTATSSDEVEDAFCALLSRKVNPFLLLTQNSVISRSSMCIRYVFVIDIEGAAYLRTTETNTVLHGKRTHPVPLSVQICYSTSFGI